MEFCDEKTHNFIRGFSDIYNLYIELYGSDVSEHSDVCEHEVD